MNNATRAHRLVDRSGEFIGQITRAEGDAMAAAGVVTEVGRAKYAKFQLTSRMGVEKFRGSSTFAQGTKYIERETIVAGAPDLIVLKRMRDDGSTYSWDSRLTFAEARAGRERASDGRRASGARAVSA